MKVETFITVLDEVTQQFDSRFDQQNILFMQQLALFTTSSLLNTERQIRSIDIKDICMQYGVNEVVVAEELSDFKITYQILCKQQAQAESTVSSELLDHSSIPASEF